MKQLICTALIVFSTFLCPTIARGQAAGASVSGLESAVAVRRDSRHVPYLRAENESDLYRAQGFVTASDRLWQMDLLRRVARGETAEVFGKQALEEDKRWRRFGFGAVARESIQYLAPELRAALEAYAAGVNAYIATLDEKTIPVEFRILQYRPAPWRPEDTLVIGKILADALSSTWRQDLLRQALTRIPADKLADLTNQVTPYDVVLFGSDTARRKTTTGTNKIATDTNSALLRAAGRDEALRRRSLERVGLFAEDLAASNNWVISGKRTADGKPLLANDPHLMPTTPGIWYMTHLSTPTMRVAGVTFPGVPGIVLGHNEFIAWGATNVGPDVQDLYEETFDADGNYLSNPSKLAPVIRNEVIKVRTNPLKTDTEDVPFEVVETRNGVIVAEEGGKKYALKWTARDPKNNEFGAFFQANRARSWEDFKNALKNYGGAMQNFVYADVKGNIGWYAAGRVPIRRTGDGSLPYKGSTKDGDWVGYIPFAELPNLYNPPSGFIVTANQRIVGTDYKYQQLSRDASMPWRARRIYDLLAANDKVTMDYARDVQYDVVNIPLQNLAKAIVRNEAASAATLSVLRGWDGKMTPDSAGALLANEIRVCMAGKIASDNYLVPSPMIRERVLDRAVSENLVRWLPAGTASFADLMRSCDAFARQSLADPKRLGPDESKWTWGAVMKSRFPHTLAGVPFIGGQFATPAVPIAGSGQTPNVASGVSFRHVASPGNWDATRFVIPMGQSGDPASPHYKDQFEAWRTGTPQVFPFTEKAIEEAAKSVVTLSPADP